MAALRRRLTPMVYVGRSCVNGIPPLSEVPWPSPSHTALRAAVPEVTDPSLACVASRIATGQRQVRLVFFGSSVTAGIRCNHKKERSVNFPQQVEQLITHRHPQANVSIDVYGYPGASPSFMLACHTTLMTTDVADLYVIEMTDNLSDGYEGVGHAVEGIMSAVRQRAPSAAIMLLAPIPQRCVRSLKRMKPFHRVPIDEDSTRMLLARDCYSNRSVAASFEDVGTAHSLVTVSARQLIREELWRSPLQAGRVIKHLVHDAVHPSGAGHWHLATALDFALRQHEPPQSAGVSSSAAASCSVLPSPGSLERANLFAPRTADSTGSMVCALGTGLQRHVLNASGWSYTVEHNSQGLDKPGFIADQPGATLDLCHRPKMRAEMNTSRGGYADSRRNVRVAWSLGYLMSYEHMGKMRGECLSSQSSCTCGEREFNGHWRLPISQPHISRLQLSIRYARRGGDGPLLPAAQLRDSNADCPCIIRLTVVNSTDSGGYKMKLTSLMSGFYTGTIVSDAVGWAARYGIM